MKTRLRQIHEYNGSHNLFENCKKTSNTQLSAIIATLTTCDLVGCSLSARSYAMLVTSLLTGAVLFLACETVFYNLSTLNNGDNK